MCYMCLQDVFALDVEDRDVAPFWDLESELLFHFLVFKDHLLKVLHFFLLLGHFKFPNELVGVQLE